MMKITLFSKKSVSAVAAKAVAGGFIFAGVLSGFLHRVRFGVLFGAFFTGLLFTGCAPEDLDEQKPEIDLGIAGAFPVSCDTLYFGETFTWSVAFSDNVELGSYSLEIHDNFDHHAHSTEVATCDFDPDKEPENPWELILDFDIPAGLTDYTVTEEISIPESNADGVLETGDYHFFIRLTDREGWSAVKGLSVKILHRE